MHIHRGRGCFDGGRRVEPEVEIVMDLPGAPRSKEREEFMRRLGQAQAWAIRRVIRKQPGQWRQALLNMALKRLGDKAGRETESRKPEDENTDAEEKQSGGPAAGERGMGEMKWYKVCKYCGAHLDYGEKCDCIQDGEEELEGPKDATRKEEGK